MRSGLVAVKPPCCNRLTGLLQRLKAVFIQSLIPECAVKALDVGVLRRVARLDQDVLNAVLLRPCHECPARELWPVVSLDSLVVAPKYGGPIQQTGHVLPANAKVRCDVHAFTRKVVCCGQALYAPGDGTKAANSNADEVHAPGLVDSKSRHQRHAHTKALGLLAFPDRQPFSGVDAVDPLVGRHPLS